MQVSCRILPMQDSQLKCTGILRMQNALDPAPLWIGLDVRTHVTHVPRALMVSNCRQLSATNHTAAR